MSRIAIPLGERSYDVVVEPGLIDLAGERIAEAAPGARLFVLSDTNVWALHGERLARALRPSRVEAILVPPGERSKSWPELIRIVDRLLDLGLGRGDRIVGFGGGVVGDLAGFAAAIVKRGCGFIQIPTTLLAQVDSSVGGKTGINTAAGKNMVGAFHHPSLVLADPELLSTLPERDLRAGYAETVKYGLLGDAAFFAWCEASLQALLARDERALCRAVLTCVAMKAAVVASDERDSSGRRALLNFGHTFGHALEAQSGFSDRLLHGEAVAAGMALAFDFSTRRGLCPAGDTERVTSHLRSAGLPTGTDLDPCALIRHMALDKKGEGGRVPFILARGIGQAFVDRSIDLAEVKAFLANREPGAAAAAGM